MRLADAEISITCPQCRRPFTAKAAAASAGNSVRCPHCQMLFEGQGNDLARAQQAVDDLVATIERLNRR